MRLAVLLGPRRLIALLRVTAGLAVVVGVSAAALVLRRLPVSVDGGLVALTAAGWTAYVEQREAE
jgi:hypothetical protein